MVFEIVGIEHLDYASRSTGRRVTGSRLHLSYSDDKIQGMGARSVYCGDRLNDEVARLSVGDKVQIFYNEFKSVEAIQPV